MKELEDLLQERLEQLEAGEPLEACLADLPEDEAELLKLVVTLREVQHPERDKQVVAAQRAELMRLAVKEQDMKSISFLEAVRGVIRSLKLRPLTVFYGAAALLFIFALVAVIGIGVNQWSSRDEVAQNSSPVPEFTSEADQEQNPSLGPTSPPQHQVFFPALYGPDKRNPQNAVVQDARGIVQMQADGDNWLTLGTGQIVEGGQRIRTGELSSVRLLFYDGSQAYLGPNTEVSVDQLDARLSDEPRVVVLTQWKGETDHDVVPAGGSSRYEVRTLSGVGEAKGTSFQVLVRPDQLTRFSVDEGAVAVTNQDVTVTVVAGQTATVDAGQAPGEPAFRITGEGEVTQIGPTWVIAGRAFTTHEGTIIVGNPQVGDWVSVEGRLLSDGSHVADQIVLLRRSPENRFTITGRVDAIGDLEWTVAGQAILVNEETAIQGDIEIGDLVRVEGFILPSGTLGALVAEQIYLIEEEPGWPFSFTGVVQEITDEVWTISGIAITVNAETEIDEGLVSGNVVQVRGWILEDQTWLASSIERVEDEERTFELTGSVESIDPWVVAGISFETREWTEIESGIEVDDRVRVKGRILEDGTWVATEIERLDDDEVLRIVFVGTVVGTDPWVVSGIPLVVDDETEVEGDVGVGDLVRVEVSVLPDGTWLAVRITLLSDDEAGVGCLYISVVVVSVDADQIELLNWPPISLDDGVSIEGEIVPGSVLLLLVCVDADGAITVEQIIVIYQPAPETGPTPSQPPPDEGAKVTICHKPNSKNPHTITVASSAVQAHLDHGDTLGPCE